MSARALFALRGGRLAGALLLFVFLVVVARVGVEAHRALAQAESAEASGDFIAAVFHYRAAAKWYLPGMPANADALDGLLRLGQQAEQREDWMAALHAYDAVRVGTLGARWLLTPHADKLAIANDRLLPVMLEARRTHPLSPPWNEDQREELRARFAADLQRDFMPPAAPAFLASFGFLAWLIGTTGALWRGIRPAGGVNRRSLVRWGALAGLGLCTWMGSLFYLAQS